MNFHDVLNVLAPSLAKSLITPESWANILENAEGLPSVLTPYFGFECPLVGDGHQTDFQFSVTAHSPGHEFLAENTLWETSPGGDRLKRFAESWKSLERETLPSIFVGIDCDPSHFGLLLHLRVSKCKSAAEVMRLIELGCEDSLPTGVKRSLQQCFHEALPTYVGFVFRDGGEDSVRLTQPLPVADVPRYLSAISWNGDLVGVENSLSQIATWTPRVGLSLNVGDGVAPYLGLEFLNWTRPRSPLEVWKTCLHELTALGLCDSERANALIEWRGLVTDPTWPTPDGTSGQTIPLWSRNLSHIKIVHRPGSPVTAKAYLHAQRRVLPSLAAAAKAPQPK